MKTIKNLSVKVTYNVDLENVEVTDAEFEALKTCMEEQEGCVEEEDSEAYNWISENISEEDSSDFEYEILDF